MHNASDAHLLPSGLPQARLMQMADALMWPLLVLRADGTLLHTNRPARRLLGARQFLTLRLDRRLGLLPPSRQPEFDAALATACQGNTVVLNWPASAGSLGGAGSLSLLRSRRGTAPGSAEVLLALSATEHPDGQVQAYARLHHLSPAETRVLQRLALGESSGAAAQALGVSAATVRSQVISLRRKTGQASVIQLLRAIARMPPVFPMSPPGQEGE